MMEQSDTKVDLVMKLKQGFVLRRVAGEIIVLPSGDDLDLKMMITLNETGEFLWKRLESGAGTEELVQAMLEEYDVDEPTARSGVERFVAKLSDNGFLE